MKTPRTLILLGVDTKQDLTENQLTYLINRLSNVMETVISEISDKVYIMFDKSIGDPTADTVMHNMPHSEKVSVCYVLEKEQNSSGIIPRKKNHFREHPDSVLLIISDAKTKTMLEVVTSMTEAARPAPFCTIITLP
jgi:hypothetical protein